MRKKINNSIKILSQRTCNHLPNAPFLPSIDMNDWQCGTPLTLTASEIESTISSASGLSHNSRRTYIHAMHRFLRYVSIDGLDPSSPHAFCRAISDPSRAYLALKRGILGDDNSNDTNFVNGDKLYTLSTTIGALLSILKHTRLKYIVDNDISSSSSSSLIPAATNNISPIFIAWHEIYSTIKDQIRALEEGNLPNSQRKLAGSSLSWVKVLDKTNELRIYAWKLLRSSHQNTDPHILNKIQVAFMDSIMSSFYSDLEPRRQSDYFRLRIIRNLSDIQPEISDPDSTFVYLPRQRCNLSETYIEIRKFKSSRHHGTWHTNIPLILAKDLFESVKIQPREFVFIPISSTSYSTVNAFTQAHNRKLSSWFGPHVTNNSLRHARASNAYQDRNLSITERTRIATAMGHTRDVHERYAYVQK